MFAKKSVVACCLSAAVLLLLPARGVHAILGFSPGDVVVSLEGGEVQWRNSNGTLVKRLVTTMPGTTAEGMDFDAAGNLYVARWCAGAPHCIDSVEQFDSLGVSLGPVGTGYNCLPHAVVHDSRGNRYVGQAACTGAILKFAPGSVLPVAFNVAADVRGSFWIDLAADGCTMFYTSSGRNVKRFDVCSNRQLPNFNLAPLLETQDLRILPDGGVLVSNGPVIARLDASGMLVQTYTVLGEPSPWAGLDLVGDGTFWAGNYYSANVYRIDLASGAVRTRFNAGVPFVVGVTSKK